MNYCMSAFRKDMRTNMADKVSYVSLGDSIATGTLTPFSRTFSFVWYLRNALGEKGEQPRVCNLARNGDTSRDLLWKLQHWGFFRREIQKADMVTVSIGGNDLLRAGTIPGFSRINVHMANCGTKSFLRNWGRIVSEIRAINRTAQMVVLNVYNPYNQTGCDRYLCECTDRFLAQINHAIAAHSQGNYRIADCYTAYKKYAKGRMHQVSCLYPATLFRNPHPTPWAQGLIADLVLEQLDRERRPHEAASLWPPGADCPPAGWVGLCGDN